MLQGTGIRMGGGEATISGSKFRQLCRAVRLTGVPGTARHNLSANQFFRNQTAIEIETPSGGDDLTLNMSCNEFDPGERLDDNLTYDMSAYRRLDFTGSAYGIRTLRNSGRLFRVGWFNELLTPAAYQPGANIWPISADNGRQRNTLSTLDQDINSEDQNKRSPASWKSLEMSNVQININILSTLRIYLRFRNEFLGALTPLTTSLDYLIATVPVPSNTPDREDLPVGNLGDPGCKYKDDYDIIFFSRMPDDGNPTARIAASESTWLSQNQPNPSADVLSASYSISKDFSTAEIEVFSAITGQPLRKVKLSGKSGSFALSMKQYPAGIYGYRLMVDGAVLSSKRMILLK